MRECRFNVPCICRVCKGTHCEEEELGYCETCDGDPFLYCSEFELADESEEAKELLVEVEKRMGRQTS